jgi:hypothetical protein
MPKIIIVTSPPPPPPPPVPPPPPPPVPPPPVPPPVTTCLPDGVKVLTKSNGYVAVESIKVGDQLVTMNGRGGNVIKIDKPKLTQYRRIIRLYHDADRYLRISDDHDLWVQLTNRETWGTYNFNWWYFEDQIHDPTDRTFYPDTMIKCDAKWPIIPLQPSVMYKFATEYGWKLARAEWEREQDPNTQLTNLVIDTGGGFIADGFLVTTSDCKKEDLEGLQWSGLSQS